MPVSNLLYFGKKYKINRTKGENKRENPHLLRIPDTGNQVLGLLHNLVAQLIIRLQQQLHLGMVVHIAVHVVHLLRQVHGRQVVVRLEQLLDGVAHQLGLLLERADPLRQDEQDPQLVAVNVVLELAQDADHRVAHRLKVGLQLRRHRRQHRLERPELVRQPAAEPVARPLLQLALEVVHERRLRVRRLGPVNVEQQHPVFFDQHLEVQQVEEDGRRPDEDVGEVGRVDFAQVSGQKAVLVLLVSYLFLFFFFLF